MAIWRRLSAWQRSGLVLSIIWAIGVGTFTYRSALSSAKSQAEFVYQICVHNQAVSHDSASFNCDAERKKSFTDNMKHAQENALFVAIAPIPLLWLAGLVLIYLFRAQIIGLRALIPWKTLKLHERCFVLFCGSISLLAILVGLLIVLDLYVDIKVPVALGPKTVSASDQFTTAVGTWTRSGDKGSDSDMVWPLQTSSIACNKAAGTCIEARAYLIGGNQLSLLGVEMNQYEIESWTTTSITFRQPGTPSDCFSEVFTIDLRTESVSGKGYRTYPPPTRDCKAFETTYSGKPAESRWYYRLSDGSEVYWKLRAKARPLPLRVIAALFATSR